MTLAHLFRHFKMQLRTKQLYTEDRFTQEILAPGVLVDFEPR